MSTATADRTGPSASIPPTPQPSEPPSRSALVVSRTITGILVGGPVVAIGAAVLLWSGHGVEVRTLVLALAFYVVTAFGVTVGFHIVSSRTAASRRTDRSGSPSRSRARWRSKSHPSAG